MLKSQQNKIELVTRPGDKQVLVHKATGRWIMRQGNRLVTVPPQALGITGSGTEASGGEGDKDETSGNTEQSEAGSTMSTNIKEQLAEFDSILESKFSQNSVTPQTVITAPTKEESCSGMGSSSSNTSSIITPSPNSNTTNSALITTPSVVNGATTTSISLPASPSVASVSRQLVFNNTFKTLQPQVWPPTQFFSGSFL